VPAALGVASEEVRRAGSFKKLMAAVEQLPAASHKPCLALTAPPSPAGSSLIGAGADAASDALSDDCSNASAADQQLAGSGAAAVRVA